MAERDGYPVHEGPMADRRGRGWRKDAARLEAMDQRRLENPNQPLPNSPSAIEKADAARGKSDEGVVDETGVARER